MSAARERIGAGIILVVVMVAGGAAVAGCGSGASGGLPHGGTYFAKCQAVCRQKAPASGPCASFSVDTCAAECAGLAAPLPIDCAQCRVESGFYDSDSNGRCVGFSLENSECDPVCNAARRPEPGSGDAYLDACRVMCTEKAVGVCAAFDIEHCARQCAGLAAGLPAVCGQCKIEAGYYLTDDTSHRCIGFTLKNGACDGVCATPRPPAPADDVYLQECRVTCEEYRPASGVCAGYDVDQCAQQCAALASGLAILCGNCKIADGYYVTDDPSGQCRGYSITRDTCATLCT